MLNKKKSTCSNTYQSHKPQFATKPTSNLVDILQRQAEGLIQRPRWRFHGIESLEQGLAISFVGLALNGPPLVPAHVGTGLQHVVTVPSGNGDEWNSGGVVADLLDVGGHFLLDFLEARL